MQDVELLAERRGTARGQGLDQALEHGAEPANDLDAAAPVEADLGHGEAHVIVPVRRADDEPPLPCGIADAVVGELAMRDLRQEMLEMVDRDDGGRRVVDRGRERLRGDVDDDAEREGGILVDLPLGGERNPVA